MATFDRRSFTHGQVVRNAAGKKLGIVAVCGDEKLYVRKSGWSHHLFAVKYTQLDGIIGGQVRVKAGEDHLEDLGDRPIEEKTIMNVKPIWPPQLLGHGG